MADNINKFTVTRRATISYYHPVARFLIQITEPVLAPLRRYIPPVAGLDFTPMVALLILWFVEQLLRMVLLALL